MKALVADRATPAPAVAAHGELVNLDERFLALYLVRLGIAAAVLLTTAFAAGQVHLTLWQALPVTAAYVAIGSGGALLRRLPSGRRLSIQRALLVVDSAFMAIAVIPGGGPRSELVFVLYVHLIAATMLSSYRSGLRVALTDSVLFILIYVFSIDTAIGRLLGTSVDAARPGGDALVLGILALWAVALGTAVFSFVSERELRHGKYELRAQAELATAIEGSRQSVDIMRCLLDGTTATFGFDRGAVLIEEAGRLLTLVSGSDLPAVHDGIPSLDAVVERARSNRAPALVRQLDARSDPILAALLPGARNVVVLPLTVDNELLGVLAVERGGSPSARIPTRRIEVLVQCALHAALSLRNARLLAEVERLAREDGLTGLANRRTFEDELVREARRALRSGEPLSLVVFDVDHFKRVNDTLGHQAGDGVLRRIGETLREEVRDGDLVARYGGEEFAMLLPTCSAPDALVVVERIRRSVSGRSDLGNVTVSAGVAALPANAADGDELIAAADHALYQSKRAGRDRTTLSTSSPRRSDGSADVQGALDLRDGGEVREPAGPMGAV